MQLGTGTRLHQPTNLRAAGARSQVILSRVALLAGARIESGVEALQASPPTSSTVDATTGAAQPLWTIDARVRADGAAVAYPAHAVLAAGGASSQMAMDLGFTTVVTATSSALGLVAHFENTASPAERSIDEFSWSRQYNKELFASLTALGLDLENVV